MSSPDNSHSDSEVKAIKQRNELLLGLSGGPDSTVVAYLMRRQNVPIVGISIAFLDDKFNKYFTDIFKSSRSMANLDRSKIFCEKLGVSFYGVDATQEYYDRVLGPMLTARLCGEKFNWRLAESALLMEILYNKAQKLGLQKMATGHYAKIHANKIKQEYGLVTASDIPNDQSYLLGLMDHRKLGQFEFPLGDLRKSEVQRLLKSFGGEEQSEEEILNPFAPEMSGKFFGKLVSAGLNRPGTVHAYPSGIVVGDHPGIVSFELGEKNIPKEKYLGLIEKENVVCKINPQNQKVYIGPLEIYFFDQAWIIDLKLTNVVDTTSVVVYYVKVTGEDRPIKGEICFKNNKTAILNLDKKTACLEKGSTIIFYDREGANARLCGSARVLDNSTITPLDRLEYMGGKGRGKGGQTLPRDPDNLEF